MGCISCTSKGKMILTKKGAKSGKSYESEESIGSQRGEDNSGTIILHLHLNTMYKQRLSRKTTTDPISN